MHESTRQDASMDFVTDRCREVTAGQSGGDRVFGGGGAPEYLSAVPLEP